MKPKYVTVVTLRIEHSDPIPDLIDLAAGRVYTIDKVNDVTATLESSTNQTEGAATES